MLPRRQTKQKGNVAFKMFFGNELKHKGRAAGGANIKCKKSKRSSKSDKPKGV